MGFTEGILSLLFAWMIPGACGRGARSFIFCRYPIQFRRSCTQKSLSRRYVPSWLEFTGIVLCILSVLLNPSVL